MKKTGTASFFRYLSYVIEIILVHILSSTPNLFPELFGGKPTLLIVVAISIAVFEREISAMIFGLICGILIDFGFSNAIGTFTIGLTVICFILGYAANNIIVSRTWNMMLCSFVVILILFSLHFLFTYHLKGYGDDLNYILNHYVSRMIQTFIFSPLFYFLNKFLHTKFSPEEP